MGFFSKILQKLGIGETPKAPAPTKPRMAGKALG